MKNDIGYFKTLAFAKAKITEWYIYERDCTYNMFVEYQAIRKWHIDTQSPSELPTKKKPLVFAILVVTKLRKKKLKLLLMDLLLWYAEIL